MIRIVFQNALNLLTLAALRKTGSILLLLILLFNLGGYKFLFSYLEQRATTKLENKLEVGDYDTSQLVEVRIPMHTPYYTDWKGYETFYGQLRMNETNYHFVKRKLTRDTLYLLCIPHAEKNKLQKENTNYFNAVNNFQDKGKTTDQHSLVTIKLMLTKFLKTPHQFPGIDIKTQVSHAPPLNIFFSDQWAGLKLLQPPQCRQLI